MLGAAHSAPAALRLLDVGPQLATMFDDDDNDDELGDNATPSVQLDDDARGVVQTIFLLEQHLVSRSPEGRDVVLRVMADGSGLLSCFVRVSDGEPAAAADLVLAYASWCTAGMGPSHDPRPLASRGRPLVDIVPEVAGTTQAPVAVVRDVSVLGELLQTFSFDEVLTSHVAKLQRAMIGSLAACAALGPRMELPNQQTLHCSSFSLGACGRRQRRGFGMVQDLRELSLSLVARMMDPRMLLAQSRAARFLLGGFPCKWTTVVIVDAPTFFGGLWRAARGFLPEEFAESVQFLYRPEAEDQLERIFGRRIL